MPGLPTSSIVGAKKWNYVNGADVHEYALINGNLVYFYVNDRGDVGAPYPTDGAGSYTAKNAGALSIEGHPLASVLATDGEITITNAYGIGIAAADTADQSTVEASLLLKYEVMWQGTAGMTGMWSVKGDDDTLFNVGTRWRRGADFDVPAESAQFAVVGATGSSTPLTATCKSKMLDYDTFSDDILRVTHVYTLQTDDTDLSQRRIVVTATLTNISDNELLNVHYQYILDPNPIGSQSASHKWESGLDPDAFSLVGYDQDYELGLGVPNSQTGAALWVKDATAGESALAEEAFIGTMKYVLLGGGNSASICTRGAGSWCPDALDTVDATTADYTGAAFATTVATELGLSGTQELTLCLMSPGYDIAPGASSIFTFYLLPFIDNLTPPDGGECPTRAWSWVS